MPTGMLHSAFEPAALVLFVVPASRRWANPMIAAICDSDPSLPLSNDKPSNYNHSRGGFMANLSGLASFVSLSSVSKS